MQSAQWHPARDLMPLYLEQSEGVLKRNASTMTIRPAGQIFTLVHVHIAPLDILTWEPGVEKVFGHGNGAQEVYNITTLTILFHKVTKVF